MAKYRLKDAALQKKLDGLTQGAFSKWLLKQADINGFGDGTTYGLRLGEAVELGILVRSDAVEVVPEYDPNEWNSFPEVMPPEGVLMRVETGSGKKFCGYYHFFAEGGCWCYEDGTVCPEAISKSVKRYRTWK